MGTPLFSANVLSNLLSLHLIDAVYTKPPAPTKRGLKLALSKVHEVALDNNIRVFHPKSFKKQTAVEEFVNQNFDLAIVVAYGLILPKEVFASPKHGTINLHTSLLPRWRGAAPIERALEAGDPKTGVTIMHIEEGLDSGDIIFQEEIPLTEKTTARTVYNQMAEIGSNLLLQTINKLNNKEVLPRFPQNHSLANYAKMLKKEEGKIDFGQTSINIIRKINAFEIFPGSYFYYNNEIFKVLKASIVTLEQLQMLPEVQNALLNNSLPFTPGFIINTKDSLYIATNDSFISIEALQRAGKKALSIKEFLKGYNFNTGSFVS